MTRSQPDRDDRADAFAAEWESAPEPVLERTTRATACSTAPGRTLLVEEDNRDGWLSSDLTVDISEFR
ncbi:hypothetical protein [Halomarina oriensis]|uniref:Uncharacterized protein n=1 Tax=Halomarina oriensis TaxID=671145 RepID=A0A6B0GKP6_9EURY|nr:hypothetical protein [Halomarina oriensis]MWG35190.1 hypothetical protein [Halomarina oriensis]